MKPRSIVSVLDSLPAANDAALARALSLAHWHQSLLHVIHAGVSPRITESAREALRGELGEHVARVAAASGTAGVDVVPVVLSGNPVRAIADYASRVAADLTVVGRNARRLDGYWSAGSFAAALGKAVTSPTIVISGDRPPPAESSTLFRNILVPIDFSDVSLRALATALALAQQSGGRLLLLHVLNGFPYETVYSGSRSAQLMRVLRASAARARRELQALVPPDALNWSEVEVTTASGATHKAVVAAAAERRADLVVLGLPRRGRMEEFVTGSTVHSVLRRTTSPVLLVPGPSTTNRVRTADEYDDQSAPHASAREWVANGGASSQHASWR